MHKSTDPKSVRGDFDMIIENNDKWINLEEAADYLSVNKDTIRNWIRKGTGIPAHKIGKLWKFKKSELDDWVKSGKSAIF
ncbi:hypothetical protein Osc1_12440 [Hominimerdicola sp. 21CYCFAH17_S]